MTADCFAREFGHGSRRMLALHCTLGHSGNWRGVAELLADRAKITAIDMPGHGRSPDWDNKTDLFDVSTQAAAGALANGPIDLVGHSFGAVVALRLAIEQAWNVRSLTLFEPVFFAAAKLAEPEAYAEHLAGLPPFEVAFRAGNRDLAARLFNRYWGDGTKWDAFPEKARRYMADRIHMVPAQAPGIVDDKAGLLVAGVLERASMPVLLLQGQDSPAIVRVINAALAERLPNARLSEIRGARHMAPLTHAASVAAEIRRLLEVT